MKRSEQTIEVPERVYRGPHYSDAFKKAWCKTAALDLDGNPEHCNASVANMASYSGLSKSAFERALKEGHQPGPDGGAPEFTTRRMTHRGGRGRTAIRTVRPIAYDERHVTVPVWLADAAEPRELAAILLIAHAAQDGHPLTAEELAQELFHHHGKHKGQTLSERTVRRLIDRMQDKGFLDVDRRAGYQGRHVLTVRTTPLEAVPDPAPAPTAPAVPCPDNHDGSGPDTGDGSLAIKEDSGVVTDEMAQAGGGIRRRRPTGSTPPGPVDTAGNQRGREDFTAKAKPVPHPDAGTFGRRPGPGLTPARWDAIWQALDPVRHELGALSTWEWQRLVADVLRHLDTGATPERLADRLQRRYAPMHTTDPTAGPSIRSIARWLIGAALTRHGCTDPRCETGVIWSNDPDDHEAGHDCRTCAYTREAEQARTQRDTQLEERLQQMAAERAHTPRQEPPTPPPAPEPPTPQGAPSPAPGAPYRHGWRTVITPHTPHTATGDRHSPCPTCHAPPGKPCTTPRGRPRTTTHQARPTAA